MPTPFPGAAAFCRRTLRTLRFIRASVRRSVPVAALTALLAGALAAPPAAGAMPADAADPAPAVADTFFAGPGTALARPLPAPDTVVRVHDAEIPAADDGPDLLYDVTTLAYFTGIYSLVQPHVRTHMLTNGSWANVWANVKDPVGRALENDDHDPFFTNYVSHPVTWGGIAFVLKERGHSDLGAMAISQAHSFVWEYMIEGSWYPPSGRDLVTNVTSSAVAVFVLHPALEAIRGGGDPGDLLPDTAALSVRLEPVVVPAGDAGAGAGLGVRIGF